MSRKRKILVIGTKGYDRTTENHKVVCVAWKDLVKIENIRDYDVVIINLLCLDVEAVASLDWKSILEKLSYTNCLDIVWNEGRIYVIGDPRFDITIKNPDDSSQKNVSFLDWTGINFFWDSDGGDSIMYVDDYKHRAFDDYAKHLHEWTYSLQSCEIDQSKIKDRFSADFLQKKGLKISADLDRICWNRYKSNLLFRVACTFYLGGTAAKSCEPITFLPKISLNEDETIQLVLKDLCGIETELPEPEWINTFQVPGQDAVDKTIQNIQTKINEEYEKLGKVIEEKKKIRECLKLLYEREFALEPVARNILRSLGAHVEDPTEPNKEDGWVTIKIGENLLEGVLEVKSTKSDTFSEEGRKQLLDWIDRGRTIRQKNYKGIFIGNSAVDKPLKERPWAFSDSWSKAAELSSICAIKTEDLYIIYLLHCDKKLNINSFWEDVFKTNGIFDMKKYIELFNPTDKEENKN